MRKVALGISAVCIAPVIAFSVLWTAILFLLTSMAVVDFFVGL